MNLLEDFIALFFPVTCAICGKSLFKNEAVICTPCFSHLPETNYHKQKENPVSRVFWGRVPVETGTALYFYKKGGSVQKLIHEMKYRGHKEIGTFLGKMYGTQLAEIEHFQSLDAIIPIPLHKKKLKKRGFNQAALFGQGLAEALKIEMDTRHVVRRVETATQTKKARYKRWENVSEIFHIDDPLALEGKHILLVDDVITTGATMEACLQTLIKVPGIRLSVASIAFAHF
jgi:ComF family protein